MDKTRANARRGFPKRQGLDSENRYSQGRSFGPIDKMMRMKLKKSSQLGVGFRSQPADRFAGDRLFPVRRKPLP